MRTRRSERPRARPKPIVRKLSSDEVEARDFVLSAEPGVWYRFVHDFSDAAAVKRLINKTAQAYGRRVHWGYFRSDGKLGVSISAPDPPIEFTP